jgi:hypothetical protein
MIDTMPGDGASTNEKDDDMCSRDKGGASFGQVRKRKASKFALSCVSPVRRQPEHTIAMNFDRMDQVYSGHDRTRNPSSSIWCRYSRPCCGQSPLQANPKSLIAKPLFLHLQSGQSPNRRRVRRRVISDFASSRLQSMLQSPTLMACDCQLSS